MNTGIQIRDMDESDLERIIEIEQENFAHPWKKEHFLSNIYSRYDVSCRVAVLDQNIVGFVIVWYIAAYFGDEGESHIHNIAVSCDSQRQGIGTMLLRDVVKTGLQKHCTITLLEVRESNAGARFFYKMMGFEEVGRRSKYYQNEDAIIMEAPSEKIVKIQV